MDRSHAPLRSIGPRLLAASVIAFALATPGCGASDAAGPSASATSATSLDAAVLAEAAPTTTLAIIQYVGGATYVTGRIADFEITQGTVTTDESGGSHSRDGTIAYEVISDDDRVAGTVTGTWHSDRWGTGLSNAALVQWGEATLTTEQGYWEAPYFGAFASPYGDVVTRWWEGHGGLEGLTFYMWVAGSEVGDPNYEWGGIIYPGGPPPHAQ